jgi:hypothetical protein
VLEPFDVATEGRMATLLDPFGAAVSLWQAREFAGWTHPVGVPGAPHRMVHTCADPVEARAFYTHLGMRVEAADFVETSDAPGWEASLVVAELEGIDARIAAHGAGSWAWSEDESRLRISSPDGLNFPIERIGPA